MEVDDIQTPQPARKFSRVNSNGGRIDSSKIAPEPPQDNKPQPTTTAATTTPTTTDLVAATANRLRQWPHHQSRIIRVSRASGGKDRHSKVWTARGPRDRRVRLSVNTAIQFYDLQDRLGVEQPSKAVEWLIKAAADAINELPSLDSCATFPPETPRQLSEAADNINNNNSAEHDPDGYPGQNPNPQLSKSGCSSNNSENSKGSGLSLSRTEIRVKARERARERTAKEKEKEVPVEPGTTARVHVSGGQGHHQASSFTQLLTGGISSSPASSSPPGPTSLSPDVGLFHKSNTRGGNPTTTATTTSTTTTNQWLASNATVMDYFGNAGGLLGAASSRQMQLPQAMVISSHGLNHHGHNNHHHHQQEQQHFPFVSGDQQHLIQVGGGGGGGGGGGNVYNFNFSISSTTGSSGGGLGLGAGYNSSRGTLQSNSPSLLPPYLQRFSTTDGSSSSSVPFFLGGAPVSSADDHQFQPPGLQLCYGDGARHSDHKGKTKN